MRQSDDGEVRRKDVLGTSCHNLGGIFICDLCFIRICYINKFFQRFLLLCDVAESF